VVFNRQFRGFHLSPLGNTYDLIGNDEITCGNVYSTLWYLDAVVAEGLDWVNPSASSGQALGHRLQVRTRDSAYISAST
jgi:hypothetical protein